MDLRSLFDAGVDFAFQTMLCLVEHGGQVVGSIANMTWPFYWLGKIYAGN